MTDFPERLSWRTVAHRTGPGMSSTTQVAQVPGGVLVKQLERDGGRDDTVAVALCFVPTPPEPLDPIQTLTITQPEPLEIIEDV